MAIKKQEFYEGAALHLLVRSGSVNAIRYEPPFFKVNARHVLLLKYSTKGRSPWGFSFSPEEQRLLQDHQGSSDTTIGLICGHDGVAALALDAYLSIATPRPASVHIGCYRQHGEHYHIGGPDGVLNRKISPSTWQKLFES